LYMQNKVNKMITITVKVSQYNNSTAEVKVEKELFWSNGIPYTLEDYVIFNESKNK